MSLLVLQLPAPARLHPSRTDQPGADPAASVAEVSFVLSPDGRRVEDSGSCAPALLTGRARGIASVIAVLADNAVSWQHITCPKAPAARLRAALTGLLEETLLDEPDTLHLALQPDARPGESAWVACTDRVWLAGQLQALEQAGLTVDRVVPGAAPLNGIDAPASLHLQTGAEVPVGDTAIPAGVEHLRLTWAHAGGVGCWPVGGSLVRKMLPQPVPDDVIVSATPAAAAAAQAWLGRPVRIENNAERLLGAAASAWNLRQFELAPRHRGTATLRQAWRELFSPAWRPVRIGLVGLLLVQLIGLNAWAWMQKSQLESRRASMTALLRTAHPQVRAILDAPVQMQRETDTLRAAAGRPGDSDLEVLMQVAASAWPDNLPLQTIKFELGQLTLAANGLGEDQIGRMRETLRPAGWQVESADQRITLRRLPAAAGTPR
ncbi:MAG: ral secretion pathway protein [Pseudomonadota bacterium]|jgi:general secretion pathway protein L